MSAGSASVVTIVAPPGEPSASTGLPSRSTIVGAIDERGRSPPSTRLGAVGSSSEKSVSAGRGSSAWTGRAAVGEGERRGLHEEVQGLRPVAASEVGPSGPTATGGWSTASTIDCAIGPP